MEEIEIIGFKPNEEKRLRMPLFTMPVAAGIPIPAESDIEREIDLNEYLVEHPAATFFARVRGISMVYAGIRDGDILVVDTAVEPTDKRIVVASINNELTVKIFRVIEGEVFLESQNHQFLPLRIEPYMEFRVLGTVTKIIHSL